MKTKNSNEGIAKVIRGTYLTLLPQTSDAIQKLQGLADKATMLTKVIRAREYCLETQSAHRLAGNAYKLANEFPSFKELPWHVKSMLAITASNHAVQSFKPSSPARFRSIYLYPYCFTLEQNGERFKRRTSDNHYYTDMGRFVSHADLQSDASLTLKLRAPLTFVVPLKENNQRIAKLRQLANEGEVSNEPILSWKDGKLKLYVSVSRRPKLPSIKQLYEAKDRLAFIGVDLNSIHGIAVAHVSMSHTIEWSQVFKIDNPLLSKDYTDRIANLMRCGNRAIAGQMISKAAHSVRVQHYDIARQIVDKATELKSEGLTPVIAIERLDYHSLVKSLGNIRSKRVRKAIASTVLSALDRLERMALWHDIRVWKVSPWGTSKQCFRGHNAIAWEGNEYEKRCPKCGRLAHRHINASANIAWRAWKVIKRVAQSL